MVDPLLIRQAKDSPVEERLAVIGELWDSIDHDARAVSPSVAALIDERVADARAQPMVGRSWDEIRADWRSDR